MTLPTPAAALAFALRNWLVLVLALLLSVQTVRIEGFGIWPLKIHGLQDKYAGALAKLNEARAELHRISTARNEQKAETRDNIAKAETGQRIADKVADKIEAAPTEPGCKTPTAILEADL